MKTNKYLLLLLSAVLLTACTDDLMTPQAPTYSPLADYDGPLAVSISMTGSDGATRTETNLTDNIVTDNFFGKHPFPKTRFSANDAIGIIHIVSQDGGGDYQVLQYKAVTTDGGTSWTIQDLEGHETALHHFAGHENYYYAYAPFKEGGLGKGDYDLATLPRCEVTTFDEFGKESGTKEVETPAYKLFEKMINTTLYDGGTVGDETRKPQNTADAFNACDLLAARGECTLNKTDGKPDGTATLSLRLDHLMALDILMLKKWDGKVTVYGCYDTWVAPNGTIWRMKQRLGPVQKVVMDGTQWPQTEPVAAESIHKRDADDQETGEFVPAFEGLGKWLLGLSTDTCKFYMQLVKPGIPRPGYGYRNRAIDCGWVVDIPPVPAGQYCVVGTPYFRYFRNQGFNPSADNEAGETWSIESQWKTYYKNMPYTWTYEEILFPRSNIRYDYDEILEVGDLLTGEGNIVKASDADGSEVGRVMWIAFGCWEYIHDTGIWDANGRLSAQLEIENHKGTSWIGNVPYDVSDDEKFLTGVNYFPHYYGGYDDGKETGRDRWWCTAPSPWRYDNGYRAKGREASTMTDLGEVRHFVIDHAAYGLSSLDDYWSHEVCNHFLVFAMKDTDCGTYNDAIHQSVISAIHKEGGKDYDECMTLSDYGWLSYSAGSNFLSRQFFDNQAGRLRSTVSASVWGAQAHRCPGWCPPSRSMKWPCVLNWNMPRMMFWTLALVR